MACRPGPLGRAGRPGVCTSRCPSAAGSGLLSVLLSPATPHPVTNLESGLRPQLTTAPAAADTGAASTRWALQWQPPRGSHLSHWPLSPGPVSPPDLGSLEDASTQTSPCWALPLFCATTLNVTYVVTAPHFLSLHVRCPRILVSRTQLPLSRTADVSRHSETNTRLISCPTSPLPAGLPPARQGVTPPFQFLRQTCGVFFSTSGIP